MKHKVPITVIVNIPHQQTSYITHIHYVMPYIHDKWVNTPSNLATVHHTSQKQNNVSLITIYFHIWPMKSTVHKLRCNEHSLPHHQRLCMLCDNSRIEDVVHVTIECEAYAELRVIRRWSKLFRNEHRQNMKWFMNQDDQYTLRAFICTMFRMRQAKLSERHLQADLMDPELP